MNQRYYRNLYRSSFAAVVFACMPTTCLAAQAASGDVFPYQVHESTLPNGLRVVVIPYDSPGTVSYNVIVRTGSRDEVEPGHSGFAHFFEHMMFRGTDRYSGTAYNEVLKRMGADSNAFTSDDRTHYYIIGPSAQLETMMDIESDRFQHLKYSDEDFRRESLAVLGEYNKSVSSPFMPMYEKMRDLAFSKHTYKHTTIGFLADIKAMPDKYAYSLAFFKRFYRPENCVLLVVGDVEPVHVAKLATQYYGSWASGYQSPQVEPEPAQTAPQHAHVDWPGPINPHLMIGYRAGAFSDDQIDTAAMELIGQLLFSESAPLYQQLVVDEQWVDSISGGFSAHRDPYLFTIFSRVKSTELVPKVRAAIDEHIERLQNETVDQVRLTRIKSHLRYGFAASLDSPGAVAFTVGNYISLTGDPASINRIYNLYDKVTPDDIRRVARKLFTETTRTVVTLSHKDAKGGA